MLAAMLAAATVLLVSAAPSYADGRADDGGADDGGADAMGLEAVLGIGGRDVPAAWRPVTVTLAPDAPLRGRVLVAADQGGGVVLRTRDVEVGAGTEKRYHLLVPPGGAVRVQVAEDDSDRVVTVTPRRDVVDGVLVGVLGGLDPQALPRTTLPTTDQRVAPVRLDHGLLDLGPRALQSLAALVVRQSDLVALPEAHRAAVARYVADGGGLVVVATTDPDLGLPWRTFTERTPAGLVAAPGAWGAAAADLAGRSATGAAGEIDVAAVAAGRGRVATTTWDLGTGPLTAAATWEHLAQPQGGLATGSRQDAHDLPGRVERSFGTTVGEPPSIGWLAVFFVVYVVVAGPVLGVVLSRRRHPELAWIVLPVVTALFAGAAFLGATGARPRIGAAAEVASWVDGLGTTLAVGGVRAPRAGQHDLVLPGVGWDVEGASWSGSARVVTGDDTTVTLALPAQSFGALVARRPLDGPPPLDVEVALFDGEARVEVTNTSGQDLADVTLRLATVTESLGARLPAGETLVRAVALPDALPAQRDPFDRFDRGARAGFAGEPGPDALAGLLEWGALDGAPGTAWVTATTHAPLVDGVRTVDGTAPVDAGTLVAVGVTPPVTDDATTPFEVQRDLVAVADHTWSESPLTLSGSGPATLRFRLPAEGELAALSFALDGGRGGGVRGAPAPAPVPLERCGTLEIRDAETGDLLGADDTVCSQDPPCPPDATSCTWDLGEGPVVEGEACFVDVPCRQLVWTVPPPPDRGPPPDPAPFPPGAAQLQVWDHLDRRWVDLAEVAPDGLALEVAPWVGPLGDVWVRATGEFTPLDLAPQGVAAQLEGRR